MVLKKNKITKKISIIILFFFTSSSLFPSLLYGEEKEAIVGERSIILFDVSSDNKQSAIIKRWISAGIKKSLLFKYKDINTILDVAEEHQQNIYNGEENFNGGYDYYMQGNYKEAKKSFETALSFFEKSFGYLEFSVQLLDTLVYLAASLVQLGKDNLALPYLEKAIIYDPAFEYDFSLFPPKVKDLYNEMHSKLDERPRGSIEIVTDPPYAELYIDGKFVDITPATVEGLFSGDHYALISKTGYAKWNGIIKVSSEFERREEVKLEPAKKHRILFDLKEKIKNEMKEKIPRETILSLKDIFFIDYSMLMDLEEKIGYKNLNLKFYDLHQKKVLEEISAEIKEEVPFQNYENTIIADVENILTKEEARLKELTKPVEIVKVKGKEGIFSKWWFWAIVGGVLASGITATVILTRPKEKKPFSHDGSGAIVIRF